MSASVVNSTAGQAVLRGDGIRVYGMDAELELKAQSKRDPAFEKELSQWIEQATGLTMEFPNDLIESLRSGIVLCTLINVLIPDTIKKINMRPIALMQVENIGLYLKACWKVGVPSSDLFVVSDLYSRKGVPAVLQNLASIARHSHNCPAYKGPTFGAKPSGAAPAKKWDEIKFNAPIMVSDLERQQNIPEPDSGLCGNCGTKKDCFRCDHKSAGGPASSASTATTTTTVSSVNNEKQDLQNRFDKLSGLLKEQEDKVVQLNGKVDQQRRQQEQKEKELNDLIENQKIQLDQKQRQILTMEAQKTLNTTATPPTATTPPASKTPNFIASPPLNSVSKPRNSGHFNQPLSLPSTSSKPSPNCSKCNFQNASTSKYCISCGFELAKQVVQQQPTPVVVVQQPTTTVQPPIGSTNISTNPEYRSLLKDKEDLSEKVKSMLSSIKQQDDTIVRLNRSLNEERQQHEMRLREQKQQLEQQQRQLLDQKEKEFKSKFASNPVQNQQPPRSVSPTNINTTPTVSAGLTTNSNRFTVQMNTGLRSTQVGPGTYRERSDSNPNSTSPTIQSTKVGTTIWPPININNNNNNNSNNVNTNNNNNQQQSSRKDQMEIERLLQLVDQLEKKLVEESARSKVKDSTIKLLEDKVSTLQSRPRKQTAPSSAAAHQNHIVVGRKRFNTLTPDTLDNRLVEDTFKCLSNILFSKPIEFHEVSSLNALFKTEPGRRRFTQMLRMTLKQVPNIVLSENSFEFLLYLINTTLQEMDFSKEHDLITAKVILNASSSLYRLTQNNQQEYIKDYIRSSPVWKSIKFWEDYFWTELAKRHRKRFESSIEGVDKEIVSNLLSYFGVNMIHFSLPNQEIHNFLVDMAQSNGLTTKEVNLVLDFLKSNPKKSNDTTPSSTSTRGTGADHVLSPTNKKEKKSLSFLGRK
ncbi:hypothetical protein PPL_09479 [Heterostelium album PN500]|uniref:Calponin-homology (CH) domain-containing protein n=1 Tax=Heterostelium pallidum (strain ATCC 26659 / Pp 5 / PN500) TaxID=670386 RepID=D3BPL0_HETP5|nr:hypothetical protein PPL_09479 [Heterostelium album PN500]EFA76728.1 hypothetical protein PPL_09479 [Heterostelium album PN500]|eukprot:XP_020428860.1 hypothetical protein PPL_09479 [Heterostelium album PN500]